ncbi:MAG: phosphoribosyl-ATP pyrophosphohydrolase [Erysipelotrichaceae bacterium]|jgi:predicted house-cleaning noncanonical NTP pyrophosphatase (MazG superfamily)
MVKKYNKLVRDNVLSIIEKENKKYSYRILSDEEYLEKLYAKLNEEHQEFNENNSIEELADMQEVIDAIVKAKGLTNKQFEEIKNTKAEKNGKFEKKIMLIEVIENE